MLNAAIIGLGRWGQRLVASVQDPDKPPSSVLRFVRGVTRTPAKAEAFAARHGFALGSDIETVLTDPSIPAIVLATPHTQHANQIVAAARAGKHIFAEKPLTLTARDAARAAAACREAKVILAAGHNRRFLPAMRDLKAMIERGELGQILHVEGNFSSSNGLSYRPGMWRADPTESPAGGMTGLGIHVIDAFVHLCGPITSVRALSTRQIVDTALDDTTAVLMTFKAGSCGYLGTLITTASLWRLQVFGTKGWAHMRGPDTMDVCFVNEPPVTRTYTPIDIERAELDAFAQAVAGGPAYPVPIDEAVHGVAVLEAVTQSAAGAARPVTVT